MPAGCYLSFATDEGFRGGLFLAVQEPLQALAAATALGLNPGGEVAVVPMEALPDSEWLGRLLTADEVGRTPEPLRG